MDEKRRTIKFERTHFQTGTVASERCAFGVKSFLLDLFRLNSMPEFCHICMLLKKSGRKPSPCGNHPFFQF